MDGHFSREISGKDLYQVFILDLDKGISNKISMFELDIKSFPEVNTMPKRLDCRETVCVDGQNPTTPWGTRSLQFWVPP